MAIAHTVPLYQLELVRSTNLPYKSVNRIDAAAEVFHEMLDRSPVEKMAVIHCNSGGDMIGAEYVAHGGMEAVGAAMADMFRGAIRNNAASIWFAHNHVDGRTNASPQDFGYALRVFDAGAMLGIRVNDHLVVGPGSYYSCLSHPADFQRGIRELELQLLRNRAAAGFNKFLGDKF